MGSEADSTLWGVSGCPRGLYPTCRWLSGLCSHTCAEVSTTPAEKPQGGSLLGLEHSPCPTTGYVVFCKPPTLTCTVGPSYYKFSALQRYLLFLALPAPTQIPFPSIPYTLAKCKEESLSLECECLTGFTSQVPFILWKQSSVVNINF